MKKITGVLILSLAILFACDIKEKPTVTEPSKQPSTLLINSIIGKYKGIGFTLEKGERKVTEADLNKFELSLEIIDKDDSRIGFYVSGKMQLRPGMQEKIDKRYDIFQVHWTDENSGQLMNMDKKYSEDKAEFSISENKLTIKTWVSRHQAHETHIYEKQ